MKLIVITTERLFNAEAELLNLLFDAGLELLHLRKPQVEAGELEGLLRAIAPTNYGKIVLHDHFELAIKYGLKGIHLNRRNPIPLEGIKGTVSCSCHSLREINDFGNCDYLFLSPVFDSVSKKGYRRAFTQSELEEARKQGIITDKIVALGGITSDTMPIAADCGFGGVAVLGALWQDVESNRDWDSLLQRFFNLMEIIEKV